MAAESGNINDLHKYQGRKSPCESEESLQIRQNIQEQRYRYKSKTNETKCNESSISKPSHEASLRSSRSGYQGDTLGDQGIKSNDTLKCLEGVVNKFSRQDSGVNRSLTPLSLERDNFRFDEEDEFEEAPVNTNSRKLHIPAPLLQLNNTSPSRNSPNTCASPKSTNTSPLPQLNTSTSPQNGKTVLSSDGENLGQISPVLEKTLKLHKSESSDEADVGTLMELPLNPPRAFRRNRRHTLANVRSVDTQGLYWNNNRFKLKSSY